MSKTLGIYGDSFVRSGNMQSWAHLLNNEYDYNVTNYGFSGTGLDYSYYKFITTHTQYEKLIFVAANIYRGTIFNCVHNTINTLDDIIASLKIEGLYGMQEGYDNASKCLTGFPLSDTSKIYAENKLNGWGVFGYSNDILNYNAMISHIKLLRPDVHMVYAFDFFDKRSLYNIARLDMSKFNIYTETRHRICHMTYIQNQQVATYMNRWLMGLQDFNTTLDLDHISEYYTISQTVEESGLGTSW